MLYRALSLSFLLSSLISAGDKPEPKFTVKMVDPTPQNPPQMPKVEFENPYATGSNNTGSGNSSSGVGSTAGGSFINLGMDLLGNKQPSDAEIHKMRTDKQFADFQASLQKYGEHTTAQFFPELYTKYMQAKNPMPIGFAPSPQPTPKVSAPIVTPVVSMPAPTPVVAAPVVSTPSTANNPSVLLSTATGTRKVSFSVNGNKAPTLNELTPPMQYTKPLPVPPSARSPEPSSSYTPAPTSSDSLEWGKVLKDAGEGAAIAVAAVAVVYVGYKTGEGLYKGSKWLWKKAFGEAEKQVVQQVVPKQVHANLEFHQNPGHCTSTKGKSKGGCLRAEVQPGDPRTRGLADIEFPADATHIFRDQWGHFVHDNPETRSLLRDCYKKGTYHGFDGAGNHQFSMTNPKDGTQLWVKIREGGRISTAGCNELHLPISKETGFLFKPDCWTNPSAKGVGCTFLGGLLPTMSSQVAKANIPEAVLFPVDKDPKICDLNFFPFYHETYRDRYRSDFIHEFGMPEAPEGYYFEPVKNEGLLLPPPPVAVTAEEVKAERASKMSYAIRMKKKNMEDYVVMEEMRRRNKQEAKVLKNTFFKKDSL